ncbi:spore coat protein [Brevibacillus fulvus]|uniref:Spore coat protein n=1 Tax=Brevibacillus fulvus TaxID=1125967 RepID=A0A938Y3N2_9BACL|nr:spore coat protein [Brevibacillus fulvus]MBM7591366.1 hypothetical protein [Brevibacillus fulvus]
MNSILENITGLNVMSDQVISMDLLNSVKADIRNYAVAITETATPELKTVLRQHLREGIALHRELTAYLMDKGWYQPYDPAEQIQLVLKSGRTAIETAQNG